MAGTDWRQPPFGVLQREERHAALGRGGFLICGAQVAPVFEQGDVDVFEVHGLGAATVAQQRLDLLKDGSIDVVDVVGVLDAERLEGDRKATVTLLHALEPVGHGAHKRGREPVCSLADIRARAAGL